MKRLVLFGSLLICLVLLGSVPAMATGLDILQVGNNLVFQWDPHPEAAQLTEFRLYHSLTSGIYAGPAVGSFAPGSTTTGTITKPTGIGRHYYTLTAVATVSGQPLESARSNEVYYDVLPQAPTLRSVILQAMQGMVRVFQEMIAELEKMPDTAIP